MSNNLNIQDISQDLLSELPERARDVVTRRFAIGATEPETLEAIGQGYGITRERVRQIEFESLTRLKKSNRYDTLVRPVRDKLEEFLIEHGGLMREERLSRDFLMIQNAAEAEKLYGFVYLILEITQPFERKSENARFHPLWHVHEKSVKLAIELVDHLLEHFQKLRAPLTYAEVNRRVRESFPYVSEKAASSYLDVSKEIRANPFGEMGLAWWPHISPRGVRDKAYLVLRKEKKPLHFREIAKLINDYGISKRVARQQTVHNELIKDNRFVLVGRGLYGLGEWGYEPGTVREVIARVMKRAGQPMSEADVIDAVLKTRFVKVGTIKFNLKSNKEFKEAKPGHYALAVK